MRLFSSATEAAGEVERDLWEMGHRNVTNSYQDKVGEFETRELVPYQFTLVDWQGIEDFKDALLKLGFSMKEAYKAMAYAEEEVKTRMQFGWNWGELVGSYIENFSKLNPGHAYKVRSEVWDKFLEENGRFSYTYPERFLAYFGTEERGTYNQLQHLTNTYAKDNGSRQLILSMYDPNQDNVRVHQKRRIPCTMYYQFLKRGEKLIMIHNMRSCDLYTHFPIDMAISWRMIEETIKAWGGDLKPQLVMQMGSLHAFKSDMEKKRIF